MNERIGGLEAKDRRSSTPLTEPSRGSAGFLSHISDATRSEASVLAAITRLPAVNLKIDDAHGSAEAGVGTRVVARLDLERGTVLVPASADTIPTLKRLFPSSRATPTGIVFGLVGSQGCSEAFAAIHRRVNMQRFMPQLRAASP